MWWRKEGCGGGGWKGFVVEEGEVCGGVKGVIVVLVVVGGGNTCGGNGGGGVGGCDGVGRRV